MITPSRFRNARGVRRPPTPDYLTPDQRAEIAASKQRLAEATALWKASVDAWGTEAMRQRNRRTNGADRVRLQALDTAKAEARERVERVRAEHLTREREIRVWTDIRRRDVRRAALHAETLAREGAQADSIADTIARSAR